jgi:hypothetical protein
MDVPYFIQSSKPRKKNQQGVISNGVNLIKGGIRYEEKIVRRFSLTGYGLCFKQPLNG